MEVGANLTEEFNKEELSFNFRDIKCFSDVAKQCSPVELRNICLATSHLNKRQQSLIVLDMIRTTLNKGYNMKATEGEVYYPLTPLVTSDSTYYNKDIEYGVMKEVARVMIDDKEYRLLGGNAIYGGAAGLLSFDSGGGVSLVGSNVGFLCCATNEIARHMSLHFAKEIFNAQYEGWIDYKWLDK